jgi:hypothetical protein
MEVVFTGQHPEPKWVLGGLSKQIWYIGGLITFTADALFKVYSIHLKLGAVVRV